MGYEAGSGGVDAKGSITRIAHCPIGIDVDNVETDRWVHGTDRLRRLAATDTILWIIYRASPGVVPKIEALRRLYEGKKIIVGRDKLEPTKGVLPKVGFFSASQNFWELNLIEPMIMNSYEHLNAFYEIIHYGLKKSFSFKSLPLVLVIRLRSPPRSPN